MRVQELLDLRGKTAVVTGGGSGIGRQMATGLAELGANVVLCARKLERCEEAAEQLAALGVRALALRCDVRSPDDVQAVVRTTLEELGSLDVLVNNAGTSWGAPAEDTPLEGWQKVLDVNLTGTFLFSQAAGRAMIERGGGSIVNIASVAALVGLPGSLPYQASKSAVLGLTRGAAVAYGPRGIRVNAICPGLIVTAMTESASSDAVNAMKAQIPLRREGKPEEISAAVVFLASDDSSYITGVALPIDGGFVAV
jgi:gluconate 5-dehydrogenase